MFIKLNSVGIMIQFNSSNRPNLSFAIARLKAARLSLIVTAILLIIICLISPKLFWLCVIGFIIIIIATIIISRRPTDVRALRRMVERHKQRTWPRNAMKSVVEALDSPAFILDRSSLLRYANSISEKTFGPINAGDPLSFKFRTPDIARLVDKTIRSGDPQSLIYEELAISKRWFNVNCVAIPKIRNREIGDHQAKFFLLTFTDLTRMRQTEQMRSDFVANASHELRTPLASLRGYIETLQGPAKEDEDARDEFLNVMLGQAERMSRLIDDLLSLSRIEMKAHRAPREKVDLCEILKQVRKNAAPNVKQYGTNLRFSGIGKPQVIVADRDELIQVFDNLIENASKYGVNNDPDSEHNNYAKNAYKNANVHVKLSLVGSLDTELGDVQVRVSDGGPGIASEHIPRLTERFYRVPEESTRSAKGTGLGLAIVKHILNRHQAKLDIQSEIGKGTNVTITFARVISQ